jgi:hypothetical protein
MGFCSGDNDEDDKVWHAAWDHAPAELTDSGKDLFADGAKWGAEYALKAVLGLFSKHGQAESIFLTPQPEHYVYTFTILDALAEQGIATKDELGAWFNAAQEANGR